MRYSISTFVIALAMVSVSFTARGQCTPDPQYVSPGIYPDTATGLPAAIATVPYSFTFTVVVPADTNVGGLIIPIDSIGIDGITGLPTGISYVTNSPSDYWRGDSTGCVLFQGTPLQSEVGTHPFTVEVIARAGGIVAPYTITGYNFEIRDSLYAAIPETPAGEVYAFPNPASEEITLFMELKRLPGSQIRLINAMGQVVGRYETEPGQMKLTIPVHDIEAGIYTLIYNDDIRRRDVRVLISH